MYGAAGPRSMPILSSNAARSCRAFFTDSHLTLFIIRTMGAGLGLLEGNGRKHSFTCESDNGLIVCLSWRRAIDTKVSMSCRRVSLSSRRGRLALDS
jgi:hypothetical protein